MQVFQVPEQVGPDRAGVYCGGMDNEQAFPVIRQTVLDTTDPRRLAESVTSAADPVVSEV